MQNLFYGIPRSAGNIRNNGSFFFQQSIEQGRFSCIGFADDCNGCSVFDGIAVLKGIEQRTKFGFKVFYELYHGASVCKFYIFFGEI